MKNITVLTLKKSNVTDFALEKNKMLKNVKTDWVFFKDPDEIISKELEREIESAVLNPKVNGYYIIRRDFLFGREVKYGEFSKYGWFGNSMLLRLARKNSGKWVRAVHEYWDVKGKKEVLHNKLYHYPHQNLVSFINNINYFSTLHAKELKSENKKSTMLKIIVWPVGKFVYNYFFRLGFLDGLPGLVIAIMMSFHSFLSWSKMYLKTDKS